MMTVSECEELAIGRDNEGSMRTVKDGDNLSEPGVLDDSLGCERTRLIGLDGVAAGNTVSSVRGLICNTTQLTRGRCTWLQGCPF
jgi:hypothetical protein